MTSKLDTAGLVERIATIVSIMERCYGIQNEKLADIEPLARRALSDARDVHEALTKAAAPDMEPVAWITSQMLEALSQGYNRNVMAMAKMVDEFDQPLYSASQLSALQERVDALDAECQQFMLDICRERERADAAEARVAELEAALKPFADYAPYVAMFVEGRAKFGGSPVLPTKHFRKSDFDRARAALAHKGEERS